ncbi:MAG TPA: PAC2 family protein [Solirubrobacteraceae bacterium]|nr:PAC2 family protein [Solirubrobacteraceae bacterium]
MQPLVWERRPDGLRAPALVCAFAGWNDAGDAATRAVDCLARGLSAGRFAHLDPEEFYDFQTTRPTIRLADDDERRLEWPTIELFEARAPRAPRDLILMRGTEPSLRWPTLAAQVVELAEALGVQLVVSLGALLGDVPHTRPVAMTGHASDVALMERLGIQPTRYEGPTGIVGVVHAACANAGLPAATLWAAVPHYVASAPSPKAALALLRRTEALVNVSVDLSELESQSLEYERQVGLAVQSDSDIQAFVERLERAVDSEEDDAAFDVPSGDAIAREFQRFLRQRGDAS